MRPHSVPEFSAQRCEAAETNVLKILVFEAYVDWCKEKMLVPESKRRLGQHLKAMGYGTGQAFDVMTREMGWCWLGLKLKERKMQSTLRFVTDECVLETGAKIAEAELFEAFKVWCANTGVAEVSVRKLQDELYKMRLRMYSEMVGGRLCNVWYGVKTVR